MALTPAQMSLVGARFVDVNTGITQNTLPDRLPDIASIKYCSFRNLFKCPIGARGPIFQPRYGSWLFQFIHEPIDNKTAQKIQSALIDAVRQWEPRVRLDTNNTTVTPDLALPGYKVVMPYVYIINGQPDQYTTEIIVPS